MARTPSRLTEAEFQTQVIQLARLYGWLTTHFRPARVMRKDGSITWRTAVAGDGKGFVDLVLVREIIIFAELKLDGKQPTPEQRLWHRAIEQAGGDVRVWTPSMWPEIEATLQL